LSVNIKLSYIIIIIVQKEKVVKEVKFGIIHLGDGFQGGIWTLPWREAMAVKMPAETFVLTDQGVSLNPKLKV
jgi:hypothetical protein